MTWWPGWDSIEGAGFWSQFWFWIGLTCLFAVGASAVISHIYGLRKHELISAKIASLTARQAAEPQAPQNQAEPSSPRAAPREALPPKTLTAEQQKILIAALSPFAGQKVRVETLAGGDEALANDFVEIFRAAKWEVDPASPSPAIPTRLYGLQPTINRAGTIPPAFPVLVDTLASLGLGPKTGFADAQTPVGTIAMKIGIRSN
jgi:hypothetical protein